MLAVAEHFISINGEGTRAGELAFFIRFRGCNLSCSYCDTRWANTPTTPFVPMMVADLVRQVRDSGIRNVTLTGGEPLLQEDLPPLVEALMDAGCRVEIETNGSRSLRSLAQQTARPVFTMDYKLPSSDMEAAMCTENFRWLCAEDTVKFVVGGQDDLLRAEQVIDEELLIGKCHVYLSPVFGQIKPAEIVDFMKEHRLNGVRLQLQLHKFIWDPQQRGV